MKVVLFCGGRGMRMREYSDAIPKPMVRVGDRPILWNLMRYYAHFGHREFILCLGYKADLIRDYFSRAGAESRDWDITFAETGMDASIGERLKAAEHLVAREEMFLANYADGLTDFPLPVLTDRFAESDAVGSFLAVTPGYPGHIVDVSGDGSVTGIR